MSRRRYISTDISTDPKIARLSEYGATPVLLYTWAIPHMDDWGRMSGDPMEFKLQVCPAFNFSTSEIQENLELISSVGLWNLYEVEGKQYISINQKKWFKYQTYINKKKRADDSSSNFPTPSFNNNDSKTPKNTEDEQEMPKIAVSPSPSPSPSPSNNLSPDSKKTSPDEQNDKKNNPKFDKDSKPYKAASYMRTKILKNNKRARVPEETPKGIEKWSVEIDRLHRLGPVGAEESDNKGYSWKEIRQIIDWCQDDEFWKDNILSAGKLREKITQLENKMNSRASPKKTLPKTPEQTEKELKMQGWR